MKQYKITTYDYEDMLKAEQMSNEEAIKWLEILDRGYFNQFTYFDERDDFKEYSEGEYEVFCMNVAMDKAIKALKGDGSDE